MCAQRSRSPRSPGLVVSRAFLVVKYNSEGRRDVVYRERGKRHKLFAASRAADRRSRSAGFWHDCFLFFIFYSADNSIAGRTAYSVGAVETRKPRVLFFRRVSSKPEIESNTAPRKNNNNKPKKLF